MRHYRYTGLGSFPSAPPTHRQPASHARNTGSVIPSNSEGNGRSTNKESLCPSLVTKATGQSIPLSLSYPISSKSHLTCSYLATPPAVLGPTTTTTTPPNPLTYVAPPRSRKTDDKERIRLWRSKGSRHLRPSSVPPPKKSQTIVTVLTRGDWLIGPVCH